MAEWKVLKDNSARLKVKLGIGYHDDFARGIEPLEGDEAVGRRKMQLDMGLTPSELSAGLEGMDVRTWMKSRAVASGMSWPDNNVNFQMELKDVLESNARAHSVDLPTYMLLEPSLVQVALGQLYGSNMSGEQYLLEDVPRDPMDWSGHTQRDLGGQHPTEMFANKVLSENAPSENLFDEEVELPREVTWASFEREISDDKRTVAEVGRDNLTLPDIDTDIQASL